MDRKKEYIVKYSFGLGQVRKEYIFASSQLEAQYDFIEKHPRQHSGPNGMYYILSIEEAEEDVSSC